MNFFKRLSLDLKEYFKPENVKQRLQDEMEMDQLRMKRDKLKIERNKLLKEKYESQPQLRVGL